MSDQSQDPQQQQQQSGKQPRARRGQQQTDDQGGVATAEQPDQQVADTHDDDLDEDTGLAPGPEQPQEVEIRATDNGTVMFGVAVRDEDVDADVDEQFLAGRQGPAPEDRDEGEPITGDQVEFLTGAADGHGLVLVVNGAAFAFNKQMVGALKNIVDKTVVGLAL